MAKLIIEAATFCDLDTWIFYLDEEDRALQASEVTVRTKGAGGRTCFKLALEADSSEVIAEQLALFRLLGHARSCQRGLDRPYTFAFPGEIHDWETILAGVRELFASGLIRSLTRGGVPFFTREFLSKNLMQLAREPEATDELRKEIFTTLASIQVSKAQAATVEA